MTRPRVLVIGCGFGGIEAVRALSKAPVEIILVDRTNHHLFQPLLYQVATASLSAPAVAAPIRHILAGQANATVIYGEATRIDMARRTRLSQARGMPLGSRSKKVGMTSWVRTR